VKSAANAVVREDNALVKLANAVDLMASEEDKPDGVGIQAKSSEAVVDKQPKVAKLVEVGVAKEEAASVITPNHHLRITSLSTFSIYC